MKYLITFCLLLTVTGVYIVNGDHILRLNKGALLSTTPSAVKSTKESKDTEIDKIIEKSDDHTEESNNTVNKDISKQSEEINSTTDISKQSKESTNTITTTTENAPFISWSINF